MKKKVFFIVLVIPLINSCELDNRIIDFYNGCDEKLINYESISINIQTKDFNYPLETYLGKNINEYKFGLMCREDLSPNIDGMIFQYEEEQEQKGFWMYKTYFPLTIIYFDKFGNSVGLSSMEPCTRKILETKNRFEFRCLEESYDYLPTKKYINVLEIKNDYKYLEEIISLEKEENLRLIIKN